MKISELWILKQFKGVYFVFFLFALVIFNIVLNEALHQKISVSGQQLVKQVFELNLTPSVDNEVLIALVKSKGFMLEAQESATHLKHFSSIKREVFTYKTLSLNLYHYPAWVMQSYLFILLNLVLLGAASWYYRWWELLALNRINLTKHTSEKSTKTIQQKQIEFIEQVKSCEISSLYGINLPLHSLFLLIECNCHFEEKIDKDASFKVLVTKAFSELKGVSVNILESNYLTLTLQNVPIPELDLYIERVHKSIFLLCQNYQKNIAPSNIKIGACDYRLGSDKIVVYQLAKSALASSKSNVLQNFHRLPLKHTQEIILSSEQVIKSIKKNKFILIFQPLFELSTGDILQHEALIRIRHRPYGLLAARYFINQINSIHDALILDKAVIRQVKKLIQSESSTLTVSVNLHPKNWFNNVFWEWLPSQIAELKLSAKLQFEISEAEFFKYRKSITHALNAINEIRAQIVIDNVQSCDKITALVNYNEVCALKVSYDLVHLVNENLQNQKQIKKIVAAAKLLNLPVHAVGVETKKELFMLTKLGIVGAQGFYFSEPLQEFTQVVSY